MSELNDEIMDKMTKVCICKAINRATIKNAIKSGADSLEKVQKATGAGSGPCKGTRCSPKILDLIENMNKE